MPDPSKFVYRQLTSSIHWLLRHGKEIPWCHDFTVTILGEDDRTDFPVRIGMFDKVKSR